MTQTDRPKARQSQLVTTYGIGSLFPAGDQSFMICGIDEWDEKWSAPIEEPRLARSLGVHMFRAPSAGRNNGDVPAVRFPTYHYCPECRRLAPFWRFDAKNMRCDKCDRDLTPSRFVACCENGHIEDFPYFQWVHRGTEGAMAREHNLKLRSSGASSSLADVVIECSCGVRPFNLDGSFARFALREIKRCGGKRPWLRSAVDEVCDKPLRVLQRGSSNVWFSAVRSTISIPPWSNPNSKFVSKYWELLRQLQEPALTAALQSLIADAKSSGLSVDGILEVMKQRAGLASARVPSESELRDEEYLALIDGNEGGPLDSFQCREVEVAAAVEALVAQVSMVTRLREVRALHGFTRVTAAPTATATPETAKLSEHPLTWLPATEVLGEAIFVRLSEQVVAEWEIQKDAVIRRELLQESLRRRASEAGTEVTEAPSLRFLAIHAFAHALIQELSLDAGYPVGSLRERVYAGPGQAAVLIYTASSDAAGSLGGLAALAAPDLLAGALLSATSRASWCSNDPVCSESGPSGSDGLNLAACHACLLLPETSCEHRNVFLDRVCIVGTVDKPDAGLLTSTLGVSA